MAACAQLGPCGVSLQIRADLSIPELAGEMGPSPAGRQRARFARSPRADPKGAIGRAVIVPAERKRSAER
jgi:hypothetical protein